jgi:hypothetical protein
MWCHGTVAELLGEAGLCRCARMPDTAYVHHPVLRNRKSRRRLATGRFCGDFRRYRFPSFGLRGPLRFLRLILASSLCIQKFHSPRHGFDGQRGSAAENLGRLGGQKCVVLNSARSYRGFNQGLRTAGSIRLGRHATARLQCRVANDLRPRRARGLSTLSMNSFRPSRDLFWP